MSGSVEENSVEQESVRSPLRRIARLTAPQRDSYGPTNAEIGALALLNQQGGPQMIGYLAGLQSDRTQATDAYRDDLTAVNALQNIMDERGNRTELRRLDDSMIRVGAQNPVGASAFPRIQALAGPEGTSALAQLRAANLALTGSQTAENNAQAQRALREGGGSAGPSIDPTVLIARDQNFVNNAVRNDPLARRLADEVTAARQALSRFDPLITANVPAQQAEREAAQATLDRAMAALEARRLRVAEEARARLPQRNAPTQTQQPPADTSQAPAAAPPAARTDEGGSQTPRLSTAQLSASIAAARSRGNNDAAIQQRLLAAGYTAEQIQEAMRMR